MKILLKRKKVTQESIKVVVVAGVDEVDVGENIEAEEAIVEAVGEKVEVSVEVEEDAATETVETEAATVATIRMADSRIVNSDPASIEEDLVEEEVVEVNSIAMAIGLNNPTAIEKMAITNE